MAPRFRIRPYNLDDTGFIMGDEKMKKELSYYEMTQIIDDVKGYFEKQLASELSLVKVQSPLFVKTDSGLQDALTGVEKAITFEKDGEQFEIVHSLAKWKRDALSRYGFPMHTGLYTDMKAIRKDETVDNIHSLFVEQWDWEKIISKDDRNIEYLKDTVKSIYRVVKKTLTYIKRKYACIDMKLPKEIYFITSQELENRYSDFTPKEREELIAKEKGAVFIIEIGDKLSSGVEHDLRSPDYDDWHLNGDMLIYDDVLEEAIEITSMGIRVDEESLISQLKKANCLDRLAMPYHKKIINKELPYTIGGGIGESRILLLLLGKKHIASVQASSWQTKTLAKLTSEMVL